MLLQIEQLVVYGIINQQSMSVLQANQLECLDETFNIEELFLIPAYVV